MKLPLCALVICTFVHVASQAATILIPATSSGAIKHGYGYPGFPESYSSSSEFSFGSLGSPGQPSAAEWRSYFRFNLSAIPLDETVTSVRLLIGDLRGSNGAGSVSFLVPTLPYSAPTADAETFAALGTGTSVASTAFSLNPPYTYDLPASQEFADFLNGTSASSIYLSVTGFPRGFVGGVQFQVETVPEAGSLALLAGAGLLFSSRRWRSRR